MRFTRFGRHDPITFGPRRQAAFARKQQRERDRYPLFAEHVAAEQHGADEKFERRQRRSDRLEATTPNLHARIWREKRDARKARRDPFAMPSMRGRVGSGRPVTTAS